MFTSAIYAESWDRRRAANESSLSEAAAISS